MRKSLNYNARFIRRQCTDWYIIPYTTGFKHMQVMTLHFCRVVCTSNMAAVTIAHRTTSLPTRVWQHRNRWYVVT